MNKMILLGATTLLAALAGCKSETTTNASTIVANEAADLTAPAPAAAGANVTAEINPATPALNLAPDELTLILDNGSARHVTFGMGKETATTMVSSALGNPIEQEANQDCGAGKLDYAAFREGLSLYFQDGKFVGWDLDGRENGKFQTANGIGIGMTRKALEAAAGKVTVEESTIGQEFMIGEMSGLLSSAAADGKVTNLWAGATCIAR
ncbi:MAG: hypothetical protein KF730_05130 [Sphingomonas sp.]|uniref:hypothetical protein n=1 Tax=Sphingomonas sp. TaxID=28214 RepID=UPI0025FCFE96|nr:hypothetical protein [Sphingomonas sp.]MBX3563945.1 hypothetical protein [Sphingomonas sp.]